MIRALVRAVVLIVVLVAVGAFLLGWWGGERMEDIGEPQPVATTGQGTPDAKKPDVEAPKVNTERAREVGAEIGEKTATAAEQARKALASGTLTAKIKAKMALDDSVKALDIDIDSNGTVVTLTGVVQSEAQKQRALQLARETDGVTQVVDRLQIRG